MINSRTLYFLIFPLLFYAKISFAQNQDSLFSFALSKNFKKYNTESTFAYENSNFKRGKFLLDSLVHNCLKDKYFDNFKAQKLNGKIVEIRSYFKKPTVLITYASWCLIPKGERNAINDIAKTHKKEIDVVVLFWDNKKNTKKASKAFSREVSILYIDEKENSFSREVKLLKHSFGFPTSFFLDTKNKISNIDRPYNLQTDAELKLKNYTNTYSHLESEIIKIAPEANVSSNIILTIE